MPRHALKTLILALLLTVPALAPVYAQDANSVKLREIPPIGADGTIPAARPKSSPVYLGTGPINLRSGAYIARNGAYMQQQQNQFYTGAPAVSPNSSAAYNERINARRNEEARRAATAIPSPFPPGYGE